MATSYVILQVVGKEPGLTLQYVGSIEASGHSVAQRRAANQYGHDKGYVAVPLTSWHMIEAEAYQPEPRVKLKPVELPPPNQTSIPVPGEPVIDHGDLPVLDENKSAA